MKKYSILLVDDEESILVVLKGYLEKEGYQVTTAENGDKAVEMIKKDYHFDLIITDLMMDGIDGIGVLKEAKELHPDIIVMVLTGYGSLETAVEAMRLGAFDYMQKPCNKNELLMRTKRCIDHHLLNQKVKDYQKLLEELATHDGLTGIYNRRYFDKFLEKEWKRSVREKTSISLIMVDIDYFKKYNDTYGHQVGDDCLKKVATTLSETLFRPSDFVARYGGEEFVVVLPGTDEKGSTKLAEVMRSRVEELNLEHSQSEVCKHITISLGVATISLPSPSLIPDTIIKKADESLYQAKKEGRNRVKASLL